MNKIILMITAVLLMGLAAQAGEDPTEPTETQKRAKAVSKFDCKSEPPVVADFRKCEKAIDAYAQSTREYAILESVFYSNGTEENRASRDNKAPEVRNSIAAVNEACCTSVRVAPLYRESEK